MVLSRELASLLEFGCIGRTIYILKMDSDQVRFTPQPAGWSFQAYNVLTLVLSSIFILCLVVLYTLSRTVSVLPHAYRMVTFERRRLFCFGVDITSGRQAHKVRMLYVWMFRAALLVMFCYMWQSCVLNYKAIDFSSHRGPHELQRQCVDKEADCFGAPQHYRFYDFYATPTSVCPLYPEIQQGNIKEVQRDILSKYPYILCLSFVQPDALVYTGSVAVAYSLGFLILTAFEVLVWLLYRARKRWLPVVVFLLGFGVLGVWIGSLFIPSFFTFFGNWIGFVMVLTVPWNLWLSLAAAYNLRKLQHQKWALWQEESNRSAASAISEASAAPNPHSPKSKKREGRARPIRMHSCIYSLRSPRFVTAMFSSRLSVAQTACEQRLAPSASRVSGLHGQSS